jgi:hypothetical protein
MDLNRKVKIGVKVLHPGLRMMNPAVIERIVKIRQFALDLEVSGYMVRFFKRHKEISHD